MPPLPAPARLALPAAVALVLAGAALAAPPRPAAPAAPALATASAPAAYDAAQDRAALAVAQDRAARAADAIEDLKRELQPAHLTDPMPEVDRTFGLSSLRSDYADAQRRAAGYRATLGDQHPTLVATEQLLEDLRGQLLAGTRRALASAERDAADARADVAAAERRLAAAAAVPPPRALPAGARADATGTVAPLARRAASPLALPPADAAPAAAPRVDRTGAAAAPPARHSLRGLALAAAALGLALLSAAWAALRLLRPRRPRAFPSPVRRVEPALASVPEPQPIPAPETPRPAPEPAPASVPDGVPVLGRLSLQASAAPSAQAMAGLHATLRAAFGEAAARMTVLVAPAADLPLGDADAGAFALALAAAAAGRRPLLMEARARGRLRGALAPAGAVPVAIEAGGAVRTLYRLGPEGAPVALLPSDPGEAEAAASAAARPGAARLRGLDAFDTVILVGDDPAALAPSADLVLIAAPADVPPAALAAAARALDGGGRPCGAVLVEPAPVPAPRPSPLPRRRAEPAPAARLGLRGTIPPSRRRVG
ncbi:hypothetical protein [Lichenibacterium dinghuense]|uniref:hypothetical protein n=1 Tax=Lichenibacterium dinghuense TaxID=2895977 RepID=UPI001F406429|nr:hypothetical protein [Lichenibacterium sp. 6Y81]